MNVIEDDKWWTDVSILCFFFLVFSRRLKTVIRKLYVRSLLVYIQGSPIRCLLLYPFRSVIGGFYLASVILEICLCCECLICNHFTTLFVLNVVTIKRLAFIT